MMKSAILAFALLLTFASGASGSPGQNDGKAGLAPPANYQLLFIGNSHSSANGLPRLLKTLIEHGLPGSSVEAKTAPGWAYLSEHLENGSTQKVLLSRDWTHVILQAQKYSTTGRYSYPTDAAEEWIRRARKQNAIPILFPEWPRRGNLEEGRRIHTLHVEIAARESACVAPVGLAWDEARVRYPALRLYASDGNHSNLTGALLTAFVLYQVITRSEAVELPYIESINVPEDVQLKLSEVATTVRRQVPGTNAVVCVA